MYGLSLRGIPIKASEHRERLVEEMSAYTAADQADMSITPDVEVLD